MLKLSDLSMKMHLSSTEYKKKLRRCKLFLFSIIMQNSYKLREQNVLFEIVHLKCIRRGHSVHIIIYWKSHQTIWNLMHKHSARKLKQ